MICHNFYYEKIDDLPKSWQLCKFGEIVNILRGASPRPIKEHLTTEAGGIPWIKIGDTKPGEIYINQTKQKIKKESAKKSVFLTKGSLILSNSMSFGRPYILNIDGCIHDGWLAIEIYNKTIDIEFLQYILQGYMWFFKSTAGGSSVDNLNIDKVKEMPFALPPYNEQKRIIASLRNIDAYINRIKKSNEEISKISAILKTRILETIFGENSSYKSYYEKRLKIKDICKVISSNKKEIKAKDVKEKGDYPVVSQSKKLIDGFSDDKDKLINTFPVVIFGDHTRVVKYVDFNFIAGADGTKILAANKTSSKYLYYSVLYAASIIDDRGYNRHFSLLKEVDVPLMDKEKEKNIIAIIDCIFKELDLLNAI